MLPENTYSKQQQQQKALLSLQRFAWDLHLAFFVYEHGKLLRLVQSKQGQRNRQNSANHVICTLLYLYGAFWHLMGALFRIQCGPQ